MKSPLKWLGLIFTCMMVVLTIGLFSVSPVQAAVFEVNVLTDQGDSLLNGICATASNVCTLRAALEEANANGVPDIIRFNLGTTIPAVGFQITVTSPLPIFTEDGTTIDARTARMNAGLPSEGPPIVVLKGTAGAQDGLTISSANNLIVGLSMVDFPRFGIRIDGATALNNRIESNFIGVRNRSLPATPPVPEPNNQGGIAIMNGAQNNIIGGTRSSSNPSICTGQCNLISANGGNGVTIRDDDTDSNTVSGNFIGMDANGTITNPDRVLGSGDELGNQQNGISVVEGATLVVISDNVISGNIRNGIFVDSEGSALDILGNFIGTSLDETAVIGNQVNGIQITGDSGENNIGSTAAADRNVIANNRRDGIRIVSDENVAVPPPYRGSGNHIQRNSIYSNGGIGIQLILSDNTQEPTLNDTLDADKGPNHRQNFPVLSAVYTNGTNVEITGVLNSRPSQPYTIEFFSNLPTDCAAAEGRTYIGSTAVTTTAAGSASFTVTFATGISVGECITAVAIGRTEPPNTIVVVMNTSEFSVPLFSASAPDLQIIKTASSASVTIGDSFTYALNVTNIGGDASGVSVVDTVPLGMTIQSVNTNRGTCGTAGRTITCTLGGMAASQTAQIIITVLANVAGDWTNVGLVDAVGDVNINNDASSVITTISEAPTAAPTATFTLEAPPLPTLPITPETRDPSPVPLVEETIVTRVPTRVATSTTLPTSTTRPTLTSVPSSTPVPTNTLAPTLTPVPTSTPLPTHTPAPTFTPVPTNTPFPTFTPAPSNTPLPTATREAQIDIIKEGESLGADQNGIETFNISINVNNQGGTALTDVTVIESLLPGVTVVNNQPTCSRTQNTIACGVGTLIGGGRARVNFTVQSQGVNPLLGQTRVQSNQGGTVLDDPYLVKFASPPFALPGDEVTWTIYVINPGSSPVDNITVRDALPASLEVLSADATRGQVSITRTGILFRVSRLNPIDSITITARTRVQDDSPPIMTNNACLTTGTQTIPECASAHLYRVDQLPRTGETPGWVRLLPLFLGFMVGLGYYLITHRDDPQD